MTTNSSLVINWLAKVSDVLDKMAGLGADVAADVHNGTIDILDVLLVFWIFFAACIVAGVTYWDLNRKKNQGEVGPGQQQGRSRDGAQRTGDHHDGGLHGGTARDSSGSFAGGQGESCRWVNSVVAWLYLHQSQAPGHIVLSWLKALNEHTKKRGVSESINKMNDFLFYFIVIFMMYSFLIEKSLYDVIKT